MMNDTIENVIFFSLNWLLDIQNIVIETFMAAKYIVVVNIPIERILESIHPPRLPQLPIELLIFPFIRSIVSLSHAV